MPYPDPPPSDGKSYVLKDGDWVAISPMDPAEDLDFNGKRGRNAGASDLAGDYVTRQEFDAIIASVTSTLALRVDGGNQMLATLNAGDNKIVGVNDPTAAKDAVNKQFLDAALVANSAADQAYADTLLAQGQRFPIGSWSRSVQDTYTFTIGIDCPTWVTTLYVGSRAAALALAAASRRVPTRPACGGRAELVDPAASWSRS